MSACCTGCHAGRHNCPCRARLPEAAPPRWHRAVQRAAHVRQAASRLLHARSPLERKIACCCGVRPLRTLVLSTRRMCVKFSLATRDCTRERQHKEAGLVYAPAGMAPGATASQPQPSSGWAAGIGSAAAAPARRCAPAALLPLSVQGCWRGSAPPAARLPPAAAMPSRVLHGLRALLALSPESRQAPEHQARHALGRGPRRQWTDAISAAERSPSAGCRD